MSANVLIRCNVSEGARDNFKTIEVEGADGSEFFSIEERFLVARNGELLLPVQKLGRDSGTGQILIQLPVEADSGANRAWITEDSICNNEVVA